LSIYHRFILLGVITLFLLPGAAGGQSRPLTSPGPGGHVQTDKEDVKPSLEDLRESPVKELPEQPASTLEDQPGRPLKNKQVIKPKGTVSRLKKPGAEKLTPASHQDWSGPKTESDWWPSNPQPVKPFLALSPGELSLQQYLEKDSMLEEDEANDQGEAIKNLPPELQKLIKSKVGSQNTMLEEDKADDKGEEIENLPEELQQLIKSKVGSQNTMPEED
jgi:hypothetical protein